MSSPDPLLRNGALVAAGHRFARALDRAGVPERGVVGLLVGNRPEWLAAYLGVATSGRRLVPMSWRWTPEDAAYVAANAELDVLVAEACHADAARAAANAMPGKLCFAVGEITGFRPWSEVEAEPGAPREGAVAGDVMFYTSGTTGRPKGVDRPTTTAGGEPESHHIGGPGRLMLQHFVADAGDGPHLVACPLYHAGPMTYCHGALLLGADVVLMERFEPEEWLRLVEAHGIRSTFMVPTQFVRLLRLPEEVRRRYDLSSLRLVCHGAAPVAPEVKRRTIEWMGPILFEFYGGSEGGGCMIGSEEWLRKPGSVGRPRPGVEVHILDDAGRPVPTGQEGHVYFNLEATPFSYKGDEAKTAAGRRGGLFTIGDIGTVDEDGYLFLCDRSADVIVTGGVNVYPAQVEAVLLELPFVADCCVVGAPDDEWGERVTAFLTLVPEARGRDADALRAEVRAHCAARLAAPQRPREVILREELPRTETGKLARRLVRAELWKGRERRI
jgi:long-chain acyl-CoA synthetase